MSYSEMLLSKDEGEDKGESDSKDEGSTKKLKMMLIESML